MESLNQGDSSHVTSNKISTEYIKVPLNQKFIPKGAMAFFILLIVLCLVIWFGIYFLMLERS
ncbi:MAG: cytochrome c oxidase subunit 2A [Chitinophagaceae bacterium]|nr:cytochrome c oxidase subunit 2A [Chitinophagaceae bacterium]